MASSVNSHFIRIRHQPSLVFKEIDAQESSCYACDVFFFLSSCFSGCNEEFDPSLQNITNIQ